MLTINIMITNSTFLILYLDWIQYFFIFYKIEVQYGYHKEVANASSVCHENYFTYLPTLIIYRGNFKTSMHGMGNINIIA